jgi:hypothetical protein
MLEGQEPLVELGPLPEPEQLRVHGQALRTRHVNKLETGDLHVEGNAHTAPQCLQHLHVVAAVLLLRSTCT